MTGTNTTPTILRRLSLSLSPSSLSLSLSLSLPSSLLRRLHSIFRRLLGDEDSFARPRTRTWHLRRKDLDNLVIDWTTHKKDLGKGVEKLAKSLSSASAPERSDYDDAIKMLSDVRGLKSDYFGGRAVRLAFAGFSKMVAYIACSQCLRPHILTRSRSSPDPGRQTSGDERRTDA